MSQPSLKINTEAPSKRFPVRPSRATVMVSSALTESRVPSEPYLVYSDPSSDSTPSISSASSSVRIVKPYQVAEQNLAPYARPSVRRDDPKEHRPKFFIQHPILIKTDIPSIFKPENMSYLKERYCFPNNVVLSASREGERADFVRDEWVYFYKITFKLGLDFPFTVINMVLNYYNSHCATYAERLALPFRANRPIREIRTTYRYAHLPSLLLREVGR
ncbi:hypothetical protein FNV43_RR02684 [Rhamnella rubrinervis]|uniref:Uncharacterized protein n=1 Tax=Rhamnella rubrinervis TaxID=2594499 RepID=A0A8K0HSK8_9ROSA|nr:hypothetical protein FNV43_RR02684 [Rhamnella rubrinervis]